MRELAHKTTMHRSMLRLYGEELLKEIKQAQQLAPAERPPRLPAPYRSKNKALSKAVQHATQIQAEKNRYTSECIDAQKVAASAI